MNEVSLDVTRLLNRALQGRLPTGIDRVNLEYVRHYRDRARALVRYGGRSMHLGNADSRRVFDSLLDAGNRFGNIVRWCVGKTYVARWHNDFHANILLNIGHSGLDRPEYSQHVHRHNLRPVFFLHDLIPITHPEYCRPGVAEMHARRLAAMLTMGRCLLVNSTATGESLEAYAAKQELSVPPWAVAKLAPSLLPPPGTERPLDKPYFVILGTIEPRKNHLLLLHLWRQLVLNYGESAPRLVIIGQRGWECEQVEDFLERCENLAGFVMELRHCVDQDLATWLSHACALLFPSFAEGYGLPLLEALSLRVPVIASDLPALRETGGDIPEYLDPLDGRAWREAILEYAQPDSVARRGQCDRMENFIPPTWEEHFSIVDGFIEKCLV